MKNLTAQITGVLFLLTLCTISANAQSNSSNDQRPDTILQKEILGLKKQLENNEHTYDLLAKKIDDVTWYQKVSDIAYMDKVRLTGPPRWKPKNKDDKFAANPLQFYAYVFIPKSVDPSKKYPLIVLPHSGIHADFSSYYAHIVRELISQEYIVVSAEYRGSTGYGKETYENIDYGGLENEDVLVSRDYMVENYSFVDADNVGIVGWSHGGMISLMNILRYPQKYKCAFAGVPVSDLENRLASHEKDYSDYFTAPYHIGESIKDNPQEYKRRSPSTYAKDLQRPLLIHTNTIDNDVYVEEVKLMIDSLKAHNKVFEYKIFEASPGGHGFDRIDSKEATDIRFSIYKFLERYLHPHKPFKTASDMRKAGYYF